MRRFTFEPPQYQHIGKHAQKHTKRRSDNEDIIIDKVARAIMKRDRKNARNLELHATNS